MNTKENWLIAWSAIRANRNNDLENVNWLPKIPKETKRFLKSADKCFNSREITNDKRYYKSGDIFSYKNIATKYLYIVVLHQISHRLGC